MRLLPALALLAACSSSSHPDGLIQPDPTGGAGGATSSSSSSTAASGPSSSTSASSSAATSGSGGSGGSAPMGTGWQSGSRLKAKHWAATDGMVQPSGVFDSILGVACAFVPAADGKTRCLPQPQIQTPSYYYLDAACSQQILATDMGCAPPKYFVPYPTTASGACGAAAFSQHVFQIGAKASPGPTIYSNLDAQIPGKPPACYGNPTPIGVDYYAVTEAPPTDFVEAAEVTDP